MSHPSGRMRGSVIPFGTVDADRFRALGIGGLGDRGCQIPGDRAPGGPARPTGSAASRGIEVRADTEGRGGPLMP